MGIFHCYVCVENKFFYHKLSLKQAMKKDPSKKKTASAMKRKRKRGFVVANLEGFQVMMAFPSTVVRKHQHVKTLQKTPF